MKRLIYYRASKRNSYGRIGLSVALNGLQYNPSAS